MTREEKSSIETLCAFIPYFENTESSQVCRWSKPEKSDNGVITLPYPVYSDEFMKFIQACHECGILVSDYQNKLNNSIPDWQTTNMNDVVEAADFETVAIILTKCVHVERFNSGAWASSVKSGLFLHILQRLSALAECE